MIVAHFDGSDSASFLLVVGVGIALWFGSRRKWRNAAVGGVITVVGVAASLIH